MIENIFRRKKKCKQQLMCDIFDIKKKKKKKKKKAPYFEKRIELKDFSHI